MEFIKFMWSSFTIVQKIIAVCLISMLGISVYGIAYHPVWAITLLSNLIVLGWIVDTEWGLYKMKKRMEGDL